MKILLNLKPNKVCRLRPSSINWFAIFVVNLDCLQHPEDVKKEDFGKWNYSGSHVFHYQVEKMPEDELVLERVLPGTQTAAFCNCNESIANIL